MANSNNPTTPSPEDQARSITPAPQVLTETTNPGLRLRATIDLGCSHLAVDGRECCSACGLWLGEFLRRPTVRMAAVHIFAARSAGLVGR